MTDYLPGDMALYHEKRVLLVEALNRAVQAQSRDPYDPGNHWLNHMSETYVKGVRQQCIENLEATNQPRLSREELFVRVAAEVRRRALALTQEEEWEIEDGKSPARRIKILVDIGRRADEARFSDNFFYLERLQRGREALAKLQEGQDRSADLRIAGFVESLPEFDDVESVGSNLRRATPPPSVGMGVLDDGRSNFESKACDEKPVKPEDRERTRRNTRNPDLVRAHMVDDSSEYDTDKQDEEGCAKRNSSLRHGHRRSTHDSDSNMPKKSSASQTKPIRRQRSTKDTAHDDYGSPSQTRERRFSTASGYPQSQYELPPSAHYPYHAPPQSTRYTGYPPPSYGQRSTPYGYGSPSTGFSTRRPSISASTERAPYFSARGPDLARAAVPDQPPVQRVTRDLSEEFGNLSIYNPRPRRQ
jgi:hypothetical protein